MYLGQFQLMQLMWIMSSYTKISVLLIGSFRWTIHTGKIGMDDDIFDQLLVLDSSIKR